MSPVDLDAIRARFEDVRREWHPATARVCCEDVPILLAALEAAERPPVQVTVAATHELLRSWDLFAAAAINCATMVDIDDRSARRLAESAALVADHLLMLRQERVRG